LNSDKDINSIESHYIGLINYKSIFNKYKDDENIIFRESFYDTKKYIVNPKVDTLYIPTDMSNQVIKDFTKFSETRDSLYLNSVLHYSDWLLKYAVIKNDFAVWPHPYEFSKYNIEEGWCGSWALGNILSAIARRIQLDQDSNFINLADKIVNAFETKIENGGILFVDDDKNYWYEEYPAIPPSHVLNGHINGILGLYDYWRISENIKAKELFNKGVETVTENLHKFDSGYWSYYDDEYPYVADYFYHFAVHIPQLKILYQLTDKSIFNDYSTKWESYFGEPYFSIFKLKMIYDGIHRRFTYKSFFTWGK